MSRYFMCPKCGHRMRRYKDSLGYWDGETYICDYCVDDDLDDDDNEALDVFDAADIWLSNGKDEDYTFGYTEDELEKALLGKL